MLRLLLHVSTPTYRETLLFTLGFVQSQRIFDSRLLRRCTCYPVRNLLPRLRPQTVNMTNGALYNLLLDQEFQPVPAASSSDTAGAFYFKKSFSDIGAWPAALAVFARLNRRVSLRLVTSGRRLTGRISSTSRHPLARVLQATTASCGSGSTASSWTRSTTTMTAAS